jgi:hypothetical protein
MNYSVPFAASCSGLGENERHRPDCSPHCSARERIVFTSNRYLRMFVACSLRMLSSLSLYLLSTLEPG